ncbi:MFS transporter [Xenorhabdus bovienii]|uniref:MFS transporter n=1 Tax=Xenorhabdus bovienii TaxID=40576 RepID=UPI00237C6F8C|nr:MFS transporter [Xenorhabdus bovienii]MDE1481700.1 MFS transporter [Xenorhabdus bovienii]MDE9440527.1 MFS transporter [Xenorhabdus bovienii]
MKNQQLLQRDFIGFQTYTAFSALAEGMQSVIVLWLVFQITHSPLAVSLTVIAGYLPSAIMGFFLLSFADVRNPASQLTVSNGILTLSAFFLPLFFLFSVTKPILLMLAVVTMQCILSLVKMFNKISVNRIVRDNFTLEVGSKMLQISASNIQISQTVGAALGGVFLTLNYGNSGLFVTGIFYAASTIAASFFASFTLSVSPITNHINKKRRKLLDKTYLFNVFRRKELSLILLFSIPSSGAFQFVNTSLPPLADIFSKSDANFYALLNLSCMISGFLSGLLLSRKTFSEKFVLNHALLISAIIILFMIESNNKYLVAALLFWVTLFITCHIICIQVKCNQIPEQQDVGKFIMLRTSIASISKIFFSLGAGVLLSFFSLKTTYYLMVSILLLFSLQWYLFGRGVFNKEIKNYE